MADIVERLGLKTPVHHGRAEELLAKGHYTTLVIRAVARLKKLWSGSIRTGASSTGCWC